jgi:holliday junction DNA helicase RuvA
MIGWLSGMVRARDPITGEVILDVGGVGYLLTVSLQTLAAVPPIGQTCELWVHTYVREDQLALYGFGDPIERRTFRMLIGVPQVGPKLAIGVLGGFPLPALLAAIEGENRVMLERIPGVGKRTAERILLDLKEKVALLMPVVPGSPASTPGTSTGSTHAEDARAVLVNLGWKAKDVEAALARTETSAHESLDAVVRHALALLMARP